MEQNREASSNDRNSHRHFIVELLEKLITGAWKRSPTVNILDLDSDDEEFSLTVSLVQSDTGISLKIGACVATHIAHHEKRRKRQCVVCF